MEENTQFTINKKYDSLTGRYVRDIKSNDIVHVTAKYAQYSAGTMTFTALDANTELFITGFGVSSTLAGGNYFYITIGSSTVLPISLATGGQASYISTRDAPLARAAASSTISLCVGAAGTVSAWMCGVREPIISKVETA